MIRNTCMENYYITLMSIIQKSHMFPQVKTKNGSISYIATLCCLATILVTTIQTITQPQSLLLTPALVLNRNSLALVFQDMATIRISRLAHIVKLSE